MQLAEVGQLLAIVRSFDNRKLDESTAFAWKLMLDRSFPDATLEQCQAVVLDWFGTENPYFEVRHLLDGLRKRARRLPRQIEVDVRAAKARGIIARDWPDREPLPDGVARMLEAARSADRELVAQHELDAGPNLSPLRLDVGRRV